MSKNQLEVDNCKNAEDRQRFNDKIRSEIKSQFKKVQFGETENIRGAWLTQLQKNSIKLEKQFTQDILDYLANLLEPANPNFALDNSRGYLEALLTKLNEYVRELEEEKQKAMAFVTLENIDKKWQDSCQRFEDIETDKKGFLGIGGKSNKTKNKEFQEEANQGIQEINKLIKLNFDLTLTEEALKIVTNLRQLVINLKTKASNFYNLLQDLESFYKRKGEDLSQIDDEEINGEAIFEPEDNDQYYQILLPESKKRNLFVEVSNKINDTVTLPPSLLYFFTAERAIDEKELNEIIDDNIESKFGNKTIDLTESVVNRFMQKYPFSSGEIRLQHIIEEGDFLLPLNLSEPYLINNFAPSSNESPRSEKIIAFKITDERENKQFQELITQKLGLPSDIIEPIQSNNEIIIIQEIAGFPLRIINGLQTLKSQYEQQKSSLNGYSLHNDYSKNFLDIIPPPAREMEQLQDLFYTCLGFGKITKNIPITHKRYKTIKPAENHYTAIVLKPKKNGHPWENDELELSQNWSEALEQISQNKALVEHLEDIKEELIYDIQTQPELWTSYDLKFKLFARKVSQMKESDDNFSERELLLGKPVDLKSRAKEGILTRIYKQFMSILEEIKTESDQELEFDQNNDANFVGAEIDNSDDYININVEEFDREFYEKWKNITPLELLEMKKEGILSTEEVNKIKKYVLGL